MHQHLQQARDVVSDIIWESGALRIDLENGFRYKIHETYPDAPPAPIRVEIRPAGVPCGTLLPKQMQTIGQAMQMLANSAGVFSRDKINVIAGIPAAGEPILEAMLSCINNDLSPRFETFKLEKVEQNGKRKIARIHPECTRSVPGNETPVTLVDDLMNFADSKHEAIDAVFRHGATVRSLLLVIDGSVSGVAELAKRKVAVYSLQTTDRLLDYGLSRGYINRKTRDIIATQRLALQSYIRNQPAA